MNSKAFFGVLLIVGFLCGSSAELYSQETAFTYQGVLNLNSFPVVGNYDFQFGLYTNVAGGTPVSHLVTNSGVPLTNGRFVVTLDFSNVFNGGPYWLEIATRTNLSSSNFTVLSPRQQITPAPYAITAGNLTGTLPAAQLTGTVQAGQFPAALPAIDGSNVADVHASALVGTIPGSALPPALQTLNSNNGANLTALNASQLTTGAVGNSVLGINVFNVKKYGALGDGVANDSVAISNAVRTWMNIGGTLYFPFGKYLDTNKYVFNGNSSWIPNNAAPNINLFYTYDLVGDGLGASVWAARITNSTFITDNIGVNFRNITLLNATNGGAGTNAGYFAGGSFSSQHWQNTQVYGWTVGADFEGIAAGVLDRCVAMNCFIGYRLPGYCDSWQGNLQCWYCFCGLEVGGTATHFPGVYIASGDTFYLSGSSCGYLAVIGICGSFSVVGGDTEAEINAVFAIGHPPSMAAYDGAYPDVGVGNILIQNVRAQSGAKPFCQLFARPASIIETSCTVTASNIVSTSPSFDGTSALFNGVQDAAKFVFSTGAVLNDDVNNTVRVNWSEASYSGTNLISNSLTTNKTAAQSGQPGK
jgi:hypothetical protein